jgi:hypothetical protein
MDRNPIEEMELALLWDVPFATSAILRPPNHDGVWWLDVGLNDGTNERKVTVEWYPQRGFGVSIPRVDVGCREGPDEIFENWHDAYLRTLELLTGTKGDISEV